MANVNDDTGTHYVIMVSKFEVCRFVGAIATSEIIEADSDDRGRTYYSDAPTFCFAESR